MLVGMSAAFLFFAAVFGGEDAGDVGVGGGE